MTELQNKIIELLIKDGGYMTCDDIAWELKKHKMHIGSSVKSLVKKKILDSWYSETNNPKYCYCL